MKFDLIIPVYNNKRGLYRSLMSIGIESAPIVDVTIIDDCSTEDYDDVINFFSKFIPIRILKLEENSGPGIARQYGIDHTINNYIIFLDCGDYLSSPDSLRRMHKTVMENPDINLFTWAHNDSNGEEYGYDTNRLHGKVYKREFLTTHNIRFNQTQSRINEDIGFNMACKMILEQYKMDNDKEFIYQDNEVMIIWDWRDPSITRDNNFEAYYNIQNLALADNGGNAIQIARRENVHDIIIAKQIYEIMCDMYFKYLSTVAERPEFTSQALNGALKFYCQYFRSFSQYDTSMLLNMYYNTVVLYLSDMTDPIREKWINLDFIAFLQMLENLANKR